MTAPSARLGRYSRLRIASGRDIFFLQIFFVSCIESSEKHLSETAMDAQSVNPLLTAKIVGSYLQHHTVGASQLPDLITSMQRGLSEVGRPSPSEEVLTPAVTVQADREAVKLDRAAQLPSGWPEGKHS